jgi:excisionase family DNA binding protein
MPPARAPCNSRNCHGALPGNTMKLTQAEAARAAGVSRTHILRAIKGGKISAEKLEDGSVRIDASELLRVWPKANLERARNSGNSHGNSGGNSHGDTGNSGGNGATEALLAEVRQDRDRLRVELDKEREQRQQLVRVIEEQAAAVRSQGEQIKLLTDQRERRPWWRWLIGKD